VNELATLDVASVFCSIQGEGTAQGLPSVFIRLAGCNLECSYCDTAWARGSGCKRSIDNVLEEALGYHCPQVTVTGGEPLLQPASLDLLRALVRRGRRPVLETNGSIPIAALPRGVTVIMDVKCPDSGHVNDFCLDNLARLRPGDELKFVLCSERDYQFALEFLATHPLSPAYHILFSPAWQLLDPATLAEWMLRDRVRARLNLQLHRYVWKNDGEEH